MSGWERLPVDDVGYIHPREILSLSDSELREWVSAFEQRRYGGWRNSDGLWRSTLGLDTTNGKHVIDYGCGFGIEALQFAKTGNRVTLVDLTSDGLQAAQRVLRVHGYNCDTSTGDPPPGDVFYSNGVLHHFPEGMTVLDNAPCQEARIMVYSDRAWADKGGDGFWRAMDEVGGYADWFTPDTLQAALSNWTVREATYITPNGHYLTATLDRA